MVIKKECQKLNDGYINTHDDSSSNYESTKYICGIELLPECATKSIGFGDKQQLLTEIGECCCSKESTDLTKKLLEQSITTIYSLIKEIETHSSELNHNQDKFECCYEELNKEQLTSKKKDSELSKMKTNLSILANKHTQIIKHNHFLNCNIEEDSSDLGSRTMAQSLKNSEEFEYVKYCLNMRVEENKCIERELNEKYKIIKAGNIIKQEQELKLSNSEIKFRELEKLFNIINNKCNDLITQNLELKNELKNEKNGNSKKTIYINDLSKQIHNLETIIKGNKGHKMLYTENLSKLNDDKCATELKLSEFNSIIKRQKDELSITKSDLACVRKSLKNKTDCLVQKIQQLEHDTENFKKEVKCYKVQQDFLTNKCLLSDKDLLESRKIIKLLETKINEMMRKHKMINDELSKECDKLKSENCTLLEKINEKNELLICVNNQEINTRKALSICNEKLTIANDEICNLDLETKCINTKLEKTTYKLNCIEQELEEKKSKLKRETHLKENIYEKYYRIKYECLCQRDKCQTAENNRPSVEKLISCKIARNVKDDVQTAYLKLVDVGSQTQMFPTLCQPITSSTNCDFKFHSFPNNSNPCKNELRDSKINNLRPCNNCNSYINSCDSDKIGINPCQSNQNKMSICISPSDNCSCSVESKITTKCFGFLFDKENLQCQLNKMKLMFKKKENLTKKELCDTKQMYNSKELIISKFLDDTKEQYQKNLDEVNAQLETYETAILYKEYELKNSQIRELQYKNAMEQLKESIQIKNNKLECDKKKVVSVHNSMNDFDKQSISLQKPLELEKFNIQEPDKNHILITDDYNNQHEKVSEFDNNLETSQTFFKKQRFPTRRNINKSVCPIKKSKTLKETKRKNYGPKLNLPCCIGSKNPCNRQKTVNLSQKKHLKAGYGILRYNSETSYAEMLSKNIGGTNVELSPKIYQKSMVNITNNTVNYEKSSTNGRKSQMHE